MRFVFRLVHNAQQQQSGSFLHTCVLVGLLYLFFLLSVGNWLCGLSDGKAESDSTTSEFAEVVVLGLLEIHLFPYCVRIRSVWVVHSSASVVILGLFDKVSSVHQTKIGEGVHRYLHVPTIGRVFLDFSNIMILHLRDVIYRKYM